MWERSIFLYSCFAANLLFGRLSTSIVVCGPGPYSWDAVAMKPWQHEPESEEATKEFWMVFLLRFINRQRRYVLTMHFVRHQSLWICLPRSLCKKWHLRTSLSPVDSRVKVARWSTRAWSEPETSWSLVTWWSWWGWWGWGSRDVWGKRTLRPVACW